MKSQAIQIAKSAVFGPPKPKPEAAYQIEDQGLAALFDEGAKMQRTVASLITTVYGEGYKAREKDLKRIKDEIGATLATMPIDAKRVESGIHKAVLVSGRNPYWKITLADLPDEETLRRARLLTKRAALSEERDSALVKLSAMVAAEKSKRASMTYDEGAPLGEEWSQESWPERIARVRAERDAVGKKLRSLTDEQEARLEDGSCRPGGLI